MDYEESLIFKVAWFYYIENMTQQQISEQLNISRMKIVKYLERARTEGMVHFKIRTDGEKRINIERELIAQFGLKDAYVIPTTGLNINESIAKAAAQYVETSITPNCYINVGYGDTISRLVSNLVFSLDKPISLVTLSGGVSYYTSSMSGSNKIYLIPSPLLVSSKEMAQAILEERSVKEIQSMTKLAYMTIVGIGAVNESATIFKDNKISKTELTLLKMSGAVGDILSQFYDKDGNILNFELHDRLVSTKLDTLKNMQNVIGVAGGESKVEAIHGALMGGYLDVLITDECTAESLVNFSNL